MHRRGLAALLLVLLAAACLPRAAVAAARQGCAVQLKSWDQCGGKSGCTGPDTCIDGPWPGKCCPPRHECKRNDAYYYNCVPPPGFYGGGGGGAAPAPAPAKVPPPAAIPASRAANGDPNYADVLSLSLLFYEEQRSGRLGPGNRVPWRGDSGVADRAPDGRDVSGGYYDAGDNVKFNLPMAWATGVLAWSVYEFKDGYIAAGQYPAALAAIKWATDYFEKCVGPDGTQIVGQVGSGSEDHSSWRRPEDKTGPNPVYTLTSDRPGSDVVGAMAGALAAASVVFRETDPAYSARMLAAALKAYTFAVRYPGLYNNAIPDAAQYYRSNNGYDDVAWAAVWLAVRTGEASYREAAKRYFYKFWNEEAGPTVWNNYDWDSNSWGVDVFLSRWFPEDPFFKRRMDGLLADWIDGAGPWIRRTPKGLAFPGQWGALRHVGNALFLMKAYAAGAGDPALTRRVDCFAHQQLAYILGLTTGRSYVVGYGPNPPMRPHHRAASCPDLGQECTWEAFTTSDPNPHTLYGALVGGPNESDNYDDQRSNFQQTEVAVDYNAGFTGILAAMVEPSVSAAQCGAMR